MGFERVIMEIVQTTILFCCRTQNGDGCINYDLAKLLMHDADVTPWFEGCNHCVS